ncbi:MAG: AbrB/MazE/SpoVT family DNA-binding domain-containing protein [Armatimonadia bacterium]
MTMVVGERGQVTIPKRVRDKYGLRPGMEVEFVDTPDGVKIRKRSSATDRFARLKGRLKDRRVIQDVDAYLKESRGR